MELKVGNRVTPRWIPKRSPDKMAEVIECNGKDGYVRLRPPLEGSNWWQASNLRRVNDGI